MHELESVVGASLFLTTMDHSISNQSFLTTMGYSLDVGVGVGVLQLEQST